MAIISTLLKKGIRLRESLEQEYSHPLELQRQELKKLLIHSADTEIGKKYEFSKMNFMSFTKLSYQSMTTIKFIQNGGTNYLKVSQMSLGQVL